MPPNHGLAKQGEGKCLLCLDAGGSPGISQLKILVDVMHRLNFETTDDETDRPCAVFDLIGGVGSGGFIAILLVVLGLTADNTLEEFIDLSVNILQPQRLDAPSRTSALKKYIDRLLTRHGIKRDMRLLDHNERSRGCKLVVPISYKLGLERTCTLRNFDIRQQQTLNVTIAEALLATLAAPPRFSPASIFKDAAAFEYVGGEMTISNPTREIISEAHGVFGPEERIACLLSLGCGHSGVIVAPDESDSAGWSQFLEKLFRDNEQKAQVIEAQMGHLGLYHRFSVTRGLERRTSTLAPKSGDVLAHTAVYLAVVSISRKMDLCVDSLKIRDGVASLDQLKHSGGQSVLPPPIPLLTRTFVMRKKEWDFIEEVILGNEGSDSGEAGTDNDEEYDEDEAVDRGRILAVTGIGGCGKTQLVLKFIRVHKRRFVTRVYVDGSSKARIRADVIRHVRSMGAEHSQKTFEDCLLFLSQFSRKLPPLILYDNVDDPDLDLSPLLPPGDGCAIIITSRNRSIGELCPHAHLELDRMSMDEAMELLLQASNPPTANTQQAYKEARAIAEALGCLPIALTQARSYMFHTKCSGSDYLERFANSRDRLLAVPVKYQPDMRYMSTYAAFDASFEKLELHNQQLLRLLSFFHWAKFPLELVLLAAENRLSGYKSDCTKHEDDLRAGNAVLNDIFHRDGTWNATNLDEMMVSLQNYSLLTLIPGVNTLLIQMHPLAHGWVHSCIPEKERYKYRSAAVILLSLGAQKDRMPSTQYLASHVMHLAPIWDQLCIKTAEAFGQILNDGGLYEASLQLREKVVEELRGRVDTRATLLSEPLRSLATTYYNLGRFSEALVLQTEVLKLKKGLLGHRDVSTISATNDLANTYRVLGRLDEAEALQKEVLTLRNEVVGEQHPDSITASADLAITYRYLGRLHEAEALQVTVLNLRKELLGDRHLDTLTACKNLANTYRALERFGEAEALQKEVLMLRTEILGERHPETVRASNDMALTYHRSGRFDEAEERQREVLKLMREVLGERHPHTGKAMLNLADTYESLGRISPARELVTDAEPIILATFGKYHFQYERCSRMKARIEPLSQVVGHSAVFFNGRG